MKVLRDVVILIADGVPDKNGDFFDKDTTITCDHPDVPIINGVGDVIGMAIPLLNINGDKSQLLVDLSFLDEITPAMYSSSPCFMGKCMSRMVDHVLEAKLTSVMISAYNADSRVPTIGFYLGIHPDRKNSINDCKCERLIFGHQPECNWSKK